MSVSLTVHDPLSLPTRNSPRVPFSDTAPTASSLTMSILPLSMNTWHSSPTSGLPQKKRVGSVERSP